MGRAPGGEARTTKLNRFCDGRAFLQTASLSYCPPTSVAPDWPFNPGPNASSSSACRPRTQRKGTLDNQTAPLLDHTKPRRRCEQATDPPRSLYGSSLGHRRPESALTTFPAPRRLLGRVPKEARRSSKSRDSPARRHPRRATGCKRHQRPKPADSTRRRRFEAPDSQIEPQQRWRRRPARLPASSDGASGRQ